MMKFSPKVAYGAAASVLTAAVIGTVVFTQSPDSPAVVGGQGSTIEPDATSQVDVPDISGLNPSSAAPGAAGPTNGVGDPAGGTGGTTTPTNPSAPGAGVQVPAGTNPATVYANCAAFNLVYPYGVAKSSSARDIVSGRTRPATSFTVDAGVYYANPLRDGDGDGIACERAGSPSIPVTVKPAPLPTVPTKPTPLPTRPSAEPITPSQPAEPTTPTLPTAPSSDPLPTQPTEPTQTPLPDITTPTIPPPSGGTLPPVPTIPPISEAPVTQEPDDNPEPDPTDGIVGTPEQYYYQLDICPVYQDGDDATKLTELARELAADMNKAGKTSFVYKVVDTKVPGLCGFNNDSYVVGGNDSGLSTAVLPANSPSVINSTHGMDPIDASLLPDGFTGKVYLSPFFFDYYQFEIVKDGYSVRVTFHATDITSDSPQALAIALKAAEGNIAFLKAEKPTAPALPKGNPVNPASDTEPVVEGASTGTAAKASVAGSMVIGSLLTFALWRRRRKV